MAAKSKMLIVFAVVLAVLAACEKKLDQDLKGPLTFAVTFENFDGGAPDSPIPYSREARQVTFSVEAIDMQGDVASWFEGDVEVSLAPRGRLALGQDKTVRLTSGVVKDAQVAVERLHGQAALWVEDRGTKEAPGSFAVGLSPTIYVDNPYLSDIQHTDATGTSPLKGDFVQINLDGRQAVVTGMTKDGFYLTDVSDPEGEFNAIYVYTHSLPKYISPGVEIVSLSGTVEEYYGFTELGFPSYEVGEISEIPPADVLTPATVADDLEMEKRESTLVRILDGTVCPLSSDFERYGQWSINIDPASSCSAGGSLLNVVSSYTVEWFEPSEYVGKKVKSITGNLRQHTSASPMWIVYTRDNSDIVVE